MQFARAFQWAGALQLAWTLKGMYNLQRVMKLLRAKPSTPASCQLQSAWINNYVQKLFKIFFQQQVDLLWTILCHYI